MSLLPHFSLVHSLFFLFFFFNDTATTEIYTLSLHDALPISAFASVLSPYSSIVERRVPNRGRETPVRDRKSTRLNSSHLGISYAVFCLKKKKTFQCYSRYDATYYTDRLP